MVDYDAVAKAAEVAQGCRCCWTSGVVGRQVIWRRRDGAELCPRHGTAAIPLNVLDEAVPGAAMDASELPRGAVTEPVPGASGDCAHGVPGHLLCGACEPEVAARQVDSDQLTDTLAARGSRYGAFPPNARISQALKQVMADTPSWLMMRDAQREALEQIALKVSRILSGDPDYADNWHDIAGYATLIEREIEERGA